MENKQRVKAISRIYKDLKEIQENPINGLSICMPDANQPFSLHCNILILSGIYEGLMLHLQMNIPETYPINAPKMIISSGQAFDNSFHHHVFPDWQSGSFTICIDLLDHGFFTQGDQKTGWTPAYTLSTILVQMQVFFANDYDLHSLPNAISIKKLIDSSKNYKCPIRLTDGNEIIHNYITPYPPICIENLKKKPQEKDLEKERKKKSMEKMMCFVTKLTPEDNESPLGYPLNVKRDRFGRVQIIPIMEILSYEGYMQQLQNSPGKLDDFDNCNLRTANGEIFNYWFPIYINEGLYQKFKQIFLNSISVLKFGIDGKKEFDFDDELVLQIFPTLMNKMIVSLQTGALYQSIVAIEGYCHFLRLFLRLLEDFPSLKEKINEKIWKAMLNDEERNKNNLGDMGEFIILLSLSKYGIINKEIWLNLMKEFIARKFFWLIKEIKQDYKIFFKNEKEFFFRSPLSLFHGITTDNLKKFYQARKVSNNLLLFNVAAAKRFLCNKQDFINRMDTNYGVIGEEEVKDFMNEVVEIKKNITTYAQLFDFIGLKEEFGEPAKILSAFREAHQLSYMQNYTNLYPPDRNASFFLKIDHILTITQWFLLNERNQKFFEFLSKDFFHRKFLIFDIKKYHLSKDENVFANSHDLPLNFIQYLKDSKFFVENFLNQKFLFDFLICMESEKTIRKNSFTDLNMINCLKEFAKEEESSIKMKLNFEGILKSNLWMIVASFHELYEALSDNSRGKIVLLQRFCFFYKVLIKNLRLWGQEFNKIFQGIKKNQLIQFFEKDLEILKKNPNFFFLENNGGDILMIPLINMHLKCRLYNISEEKELLEFKIMLLSSEQNYLLYSNETDNKSISSKIFLNKMEILFITMKQLDKLRFETVMKECFYVFPREHCLKIIHDLIAERQKNLLM